MPVKVTIHRAVVYYRPSSGTQSASHDLFNNAPGAAAHGWGVAAQGPKIAFQLSEKHNLNVTRRTWYSLTDSDFTRFKNGGKRLPSGMYDAEPTKWVGTETRDRTNRESSLILEGDVGPYKKGSGNLYKANLAPATSTRPAAWAHHPPAQYKTDPAAHVQQQQNRDHQNNQAALKSRGANPAEGTAIAIPQWIHMNGYTFGDKAKPGTLKNPLKATKANQSRTDWIAQNPSAALFKEIYHTIRLYHLSNQLTYEIVGSFRYLYKLNVDNLHYAPTADLDNLLMYYLSLAH